MFVNKLWCTDYWVKLGGCQWN